MLCRELVYKSSWTRWKYRNSSSAGVNQHNSTNCAGSHQHKTGSMYYRWAERLCCVSMLFVRCFERGIFGHFYSILSNYHGQMTGSWIFSGAPVKQCQCDSVQHPSCSSCPGCPGSTGVCPSDATCATHMCEFVTAAGPRESAQKLIPKPKETTSLSHGALPWWVHWGHLQFALVESKKMGFLSTAAFPSSLSPGSHTVWVLL